jgi:hypothetical protein
MPEQFLNRSEQSSTESEPIYEFFKYEDERKQLFQYCKSVTEYLHDNQVPNIVIIDRSSRPLYVGIIECWRQLYPEEPRPGIYFMNPKGFKSKEDVDPDDLWEMYLESEAKDDKPEQNLPTRSREEIIAEMEEVYSELDNDKEKPLLVFDSCIHTGDSLDPVVKSLRMSGYKDVRVGSINPAERNAKIDTDYHITRVRPEKGCYPFDRDRMIEKTFDHVYSQATPDQEKRQRSGTLRKEIKQVMKDFLNRDSRTAEHQSFADPLNAWAERENLGNDDEMDIFLNMLQEINRRYSGQTRESDPAYNYDLKTLYEGAVKREERTAANMYSELYALGLRDTMGTVNAIQSGQLERDLLSRILQADMQSYGNFSTPIKAAVRQVLMEDIW